MEVTAQELATTPYPLLMTPRVGPRALRGKRRAIDMTNAEVTATESAPSTIVQVKVEVDIDSAFIRGQIVAPTALIDVDIATLSVAARKALLDGGRASGPFELKDPEYHRPHAAIDEPTSEKIVAILEKKGAIMEKANLKAEADRAATELKKKQDIESFLKSSPRKGQVLITRALYARDAKPEDDGWFIIDGWRTDEFSINAPHRLTEAVQTHIKKFEAENKALAASLADKVHAHYEAMDAKAAEERTTAEAATKKLRLDGGRYKQSFRNYNQRRYGRPWGAKVTLGADGGSIEFAFVQNAFDGGEGEAGTVTVPCAPGDVIAVGQKDNRGKSENTLMLMEDDGSMTTLTKSEATKYLRKKTEV